MLGSGWNHVLCPHRCTTCRTETDPHSLQKVCPVTSLEYPHLHTEALCLFLDGRIVTNLTWEPWRHYDMQNKQNRLAPYNAYISLYSTTARLAIRGLYILGLGYSMFSLFLPSSFFFLFLFL